ncbi:MAG: hypothetical protein P1U65_07575 [Minwuia sp.]|nr:hypothetical protein [Minwuia sp.]
MIQRANPQRGAVTVTVAGRTAVLVGTLGNMAALEDAWGVGIADLAHGALDTPKVSHIVAALHALSGGELDRAFLDGCLVADVMGSFAAVRRCIVLSFSGGDEQAADADAAEDGEDPENPPTA